MKKIICLFAIISIALVTQGWGQDNIYSMEDSAKNTAVKTEIKNGPTYSIEIPFANMYVWGLDEYVGDEIYYSESYDSRTGENPYKFTYKPMFLNLPEKILLKTTFAVQFTKWTFGVSGFVFTTSDRIVNTIKTPAWTLVDSTKTEHPYYTYDYFYNYFRSDIWNNTMSALTNEQEPGGVSPIYYSSGNKFKLWGVDAFAVRNIYTDARNDVSLYGGIKFIKPSYKLTMEIQQQAFVGNLYGYLNGQLGLWDFKNDVTVKSVHTVKTAGMAGPMIGIEYGRIISRITITPSIRGGFVIGKTQEKAVFDDDDVITFTDQWTGAVVPWHLDGNVVFQKNLVRIIPIGEFGLKISSASNWLETSIFASYRIYGNIPTGPIWDNPWAQGQWILKTKNVELYEFGLMVKIKVKK